MKVLHLCLACFFPDNYSYQENLLPKFHKQLGYDVEVIASLRSFDENGKPCFLSDAKTYLNENDIKVTRLQNKSPIKLSRKLNKYVGTYEAICRAKPDIIFMHGCQFLDIKYVVKYVKQHPDVRVYVDNHADFSNSARNWFSQNILHKILWKHCAHKIEPYTEKFYGVLPARVDFLANVYKLPRNKIELLVMGADDDLAEKAKNPEIRKKIREKYGIKDDDFLVITGGKIDAFKTQTLLLMQAVNEIENPRLKLIVMGSVTPELQERVAAQCSDRVQYIGWVQSNESYEYFAAADLAVFPGRHSVFWEQVAGQGIPMICKHWDGTTHVDLGGNVIFLYDDSVDEIKNAVKGLVDNPDEFQRMRDIARRKGTDVFSYRNISQRSIGGNKS